MVIRPWGYGIWELMQAELDRRIKEAGAENAYFPLFIPESFLKLEAEHVEGFAPELAVVTHGGGKELEEPLVVRPTSETVINSFFSKWIQSHRDLPMLHQPVGQRRALGAPPAAVPAHHRVPLAGGPHRARHRGRRAPPTRCRSSTTSTARPWSTSLRVPVLTGHKTARERFAGANKTWTCEGMMGDGKALQMGTSHELGQNFARPFDITYSNASGSLEYVWQTSWGVSTRLVGALVMAHGDDFGLRLPPAVAPAQVVVMVVKDDAAVGEAAARLCAELRAAGHRVRLDDRTDTSFGRRSVDWELKGVPVRVEVGPRDLAEGNVTVVVRHTREKRTVALAGVGGRGRRRARPSADRDLLAEATAFREARTADAATLEEAIEAGSVGFARVPVACPRARRRGPPGPARPHRAVPPAPRRLARRRRATPRTTSSPSSAVRTDLGIAIIP